MIRVVSPSSWGKTSASRVKTSSSFIASSSSSLAREGDCKNSFVVAKEDAPIIDITWPPSHPRAVYSSLTVSGENLEKLRPYLETGKLKSEIDPTGPYKFTDVIEAFRHLETGRARGKVVITGFPSQHIPSLKSSDNINSLPPPPPEMVSQEMYLEAKKNKHKKAKTEENLGFPGHEKDEFGDVVKAPPSPKLVTLPKTDASQERLRLQAVEAYRSRKGWTSRPGVLLPPVTTSPSS
ncbi:hypothetical protein EZV62_009723 [Acer yangbiense]|uniref:Uncharacterized protein n=1 Tax=Acer yangbiense TaxID=1000413 RepID=A0A5C7I138_9ROSI|nr:hypothetical protein EZV62_009723 [Acer yangbiense]